MNKRNKVKINNDNSNHESVLNNKMKIIETNTMNINYDKGYVEYMNII